MKHMTLGEFIESCEPDSKSNQPSFSMPISLRLEKEVFLLRELENGTEYNGCLLFTKATKREKADLENRDDICTFFVKR